MLPFNLLVLAGEITNGPFAHDDRIIVNWTVDEQPSTASVPRGRARRGITARRGTSGRSRNVSARSLTDTSGRAAAVVS